MALYSAIGCRDTLTESLTTRNSPSDLRCPSRAVALVNNPGWSPRKTTSDFGPRASPGELCCPWAGYVESASPFLFWTPGQPTLLQYHAAPLVRQIFLGTGNVAAMVMNNAG